MCIIIDANRCSNLFSSPRDPNAEPVWNAIASGRISIVFGGLNQDELFKIKPAREWISEAWRSGRAKQVNRYSIDQEISNIRIGIRSNDIHVIALARASGARLLYSDDGDLTQDFKNPDLINNPRGKVYKKATHHRLLRNATCRR